MKLSPATEMAIGVHGPLITESASLGSKLNHRPLPLPFNCCYVALRWRIGFNMPPRKKTKRAHSPTPQDDTTALSSANTPSGDSAGKPDTDYDLITDPWTDEQETALLKAIIKWKPVGRFNWRFSRADTATNRLIPQVYTNTFECSQFRII